MLRFEGEQAFSASPELVREKLSDLAFLTRCIPDAELLAVAEAEVKFRVLPGFSFARGALDVVLRQLEKSTDKPIVYNCISKAIGSSSEVEIALHPQSHPTAGTNVRWSAEIRTLTGLLKMVPPALIKAAAQKVIGDVWNEVHRQLRPFAESPGAS